MNNKSTLIRKCTYDEFKQNRRCKFCGYFEKTESMIDLDNSFFAWNECCYRLNTSQPRKSNEVCDFFTNKRKRKIKRKR